MNTTLIKLFGKALVENNTRSFAEVNAVAVTRGYLVHPDVCNESVLRFLDEVAINPNATFYKDWADVTEKSRLELLFDQILHYSSTYGTGFSFGNGYVPNDGLISAPAYAALKVIDPITVEDLYARCFGMLTSGIALKQDTMVACADFVIANGGKSINVDEIKNREALIYICDKTGLWPKNPNNLFRLIMFKTTGKTMVIKDIATIRAIKNSSTPFDFGRLSNDDLVRLSSIFLRYKDLFLAFKHTAYSKTPKNPAVINKLRKLAVKNHKPMQEGFWQTVFTKEYSTDEIVKHLDELTNYKKVALMQTCLERATAGNDQLYIVRNQKAFLRTNYKPSTVSMMYVTTLYSLLGASLMDTLRKNSTKEVVTGVNAETGEPIVETQPVVIRRANGVKIGMPTSEKSFIGNYPFGTSYKLDNDNFFGIYWKDEWGTRDYDLSYQDFRGGRIGWNSRYYDDNKSVVFSGDMTSAYPEAAEVLYCAKGAPKGIVKVNQYSGNSKSKFQFFFGQQHGLKFGRRSGYMVDPNCIRLKVEIPHEDVCEVTVGVTNGDEVVLMAVNTGYGIVSRVHNSDVKMMDAILHKSRCFVNAEEILSGAGFQFVDADYTGSVDIDFADLDKDSLIKLMA